MPNFKKSRGFKMKGPQFFGSAMKKYGNSPTKHKILVNPEDPENSARGYHETAEGDPSHTHDRKMNNQMVPAKKEEAPEEDSPNKGLKEMFGKVKDFAKENKGALKGAGLGAWLGGPVGLLAGGLIGKSRDEKRAKEIEAAKIANRPQAAVATNPEFAMSGMPKRGKKLGAKKFKKQGYVFDKETGETAKVDRFVKGGRSKTGYGEGHKTAEKAKLTTYTSTGSKAQKVVSKKKKGAKTGEEHYVTTKTKNISAKKAARQVKRKARRY